MSDEEGLPSGGPSSIDKPRRRARSPPSRSLHRGHPSLYRPKLSAGGKGGRFRAEPPGGSFAQALSRRRAELAVLSNHVVAVMAVPQPLKRENVEIFSARCSTDVVEMDRVSLAHPAETV